MSLFSEQLNEIENSLRVPDQNNIDFLVNLIDKPIKDEIKEQFQTKQTFYLNLDSNYLATILKKKVPIICPQGNILKIGDKEYSPKEIYLAILKIFEKDPGIVVTYNKPLYDNTFTVTIQWRGYLIFQLQRFLKKKSLISKVSVEVNESYC